MDKLETVQSILDQTELPAVAIDDHGLFTIINQAFVQTFGWTPGELIGRPVTTIMPAHMRDTHTVGFSRFLVTEKPSLLGETLQLSILYRNGTIAEAEHYILAEKQDGRWRFAATITPGAQV